MASQGKMGPPKVPKQGSWRRVVSLREAGALWKKRPTELMISLFKIIGTNRLIHSSV